MPGRGGSGVSVFPWEASKLHLHAVFSSPTAADLPEAFSSYITYIMNRKRNNLCLDGDERLPVPDRGRRDIRGRQQQLAHSGMIWRVKSPREPLGKEYPVADPGLRRGRHKR